MQSNSHNRLFLVFLILSCKNEVRVDRLLNEQQTLNVLDHVVNYELKFISKGNQFFVDDSSIIEGVSVILFQTIASLDTFLNDSDKSFMLDQMKYYIKHNLAIPIVNESFNIQAANDIDNVCLTQPLFNKKGNVSIVFTAINQEDNWIIVLEKDKEKWKNVAMKNINITKGWYFLTEYPPDASSMSK